MFEQDYIMRLIQSMIRMSLKLFCNIDTKSPDIELLENEQSKNTLNELINLIDCGQINKAEDKLFEISKSEYNLKLILLFYYYLNEKDDDFLEKNNFTRKEIKMGLEDIMLAYGVNDFAHLLLQDV